MMENIEKLFLHEDDPNAIKLAKLAQFCGVDYQLVREIPNRPSCMILPGSYFDSVKTQVENGQEYGHAILVYNSVSSAILSGRLKPFQHYSGTIEITKKRPDVTSCFSGLNISAKANNTVFSPLQWDDFEPLICIDNNPLFLAKGSLFILGTGEVLGIDDIADEGCEPCKDYFTKFVPYVIFLKWVFGYRCWHLKSRFASIIIDDPLLRKRYGFIEYHKFLKWLQEKDLAATFAFIPWNYKRTDARIADLFKKHPERLSICVHGCDHTRGEFSLTETGRLSAIIQTANYRMMKHEKKHDLPCDPVMVFPQGKFSKESLIALKQNGYAAVVNSTVFPTNYNDELTIRDLLDMTVQWPDGVPFYRRRYPVDLFDFACDLFFEKPILIVQHHQDFMYGFDLLFYFINQIREINPGIQWVPLGTNLSRSVWQKFEKDGSHSTRKAYIETCHSHAHLHELNYSLKERVKIASRRYLCELRDNYIQKNLWLSSFLGRIGGKIRTEK